jgi:hypothetical protein
MEEAEDCWRFQKGGQHYPEEGALVKLDYVPNINGRDFTVWGGKRTVVASSLSLMWSPKDTAHTYACLRHFASPKL